MIGWLIAMLLLGLIVGFLAGVKVTWDEFEKEIKSGFVTIRGTMYKAQKGE